MKKGKNCTCAKKLWGDTKKKGSKPRERCAFPPFPCYLFFYNTAFILEEQKTGV